MVTDFAVYEYSTHLDLDTYEHFILPKCTNDPSQYLHTPVCKYVSHQEGIHLPWASVRLATYMPTYLLDTSRMASQ